jgi:hypothetical protein
VNETKGWLQSKTILAALLVVGDGLLKLAQAVIDWINSGHQITGLITIVYPVAEVVVGSLIVYFRKGATATVSGSAVVSK